MKHLITILILLVNSGLVFAQIVKEDTILLEGIEVRTRQIEELPTYSSLKVDSLAFVRHNSSNIARLLDEQPGMFIKKYGVTGIAVPSLRGTGSSHTQVYWNGFNVNSPMLGQTDLSMIPVVAQDEVIVNFGGASLINGTGGIGGSIVLGSQPSFRQRLELSGNISYGSFSTISGSGTLKWGNENFSWITKVYGNRAENDFEYLDINFETKKTENAQSNQQGFLQELYLKTGRSSHAYIKGWWQDLDRNIQAPITVSFSNENLKNEFLKIVGGWDVAGAKSFTSVSMAYLMDDLLFSNPAASLASSNRVDGAKIRVQRSQFLSNWQLKFSIDAGHDQANSELYTSTQFQDRFSLLASGLWSLNDRWNIDLLVRSENVDDTWSGILPSFSMSYQIDEKDQWSIQAAANRNFRALTLNERYWADDGDIELKPENSVNAEATLRFKKKITNNHLIQNITAFYNNVDNWIQWVPGMPVWRPRNALKVISSGVEYKIEAPDMTLGSVGLNTNLNYTYTSALNKDQQNEGAYNKQLIFTPKHKGVLNIGLQYQKFGLSITQELVGKRYTTSDNSEWLPSYYLTNLYLHRNLNSKKLLTTIGLRVDNIFGYHYQVMPFYAMPTQYVELSLLVKWRR